MSKQEILQLRYLNKWIFDINCELNNGSPIIRQEDANSVIQAITIISNAIRDEYPFYAAELPRIAQILFNFNTFGLFNLNNAAFGELFLIIKHLSNEPVDIQFWTMIHPRICKISKDLFCDGYYDSASEKAVKEVETRLRKLHKEIKPDVCVPSKVIDIIGALLSEKGCYQFCDTSTTSGQDYRRGIKLLFEGLFAAYRNPSSHANIECSKRQAFDQISLASQLMFVLDSK